MKTKKVLALAVLAAFALGSVGATELSTIIESAKENSPSYKNSVITYQNGLINVQRLEKNDDQIVVTVTGDNAESVMPTATEQVLSLSTNINDDMVVSATPTVIVQLPNDGKTKITGTLNTTADTDGGVTSLSGKAGVSHTIDFVGYKSQSEDIAYTTTKYSTELSYRNATLNFEKTVLSSVQALLTAEKSMEKSYDTLAKQKKSLANMELLGTFSKTSPNYIRIKNTIQTLEESLAAAEQQLADARYNYKILTGMDWDYLDPLPEPVLNLVTYDEGNTSVMLTSLSAQSAMDNYYARLAAYNPNALVLAGNVYAGGNLDDTSKYQVNGSATYTSKNWSAGFTPSVTLNNTPVADTQVYSLSGNVRYDDDNWYVKVAPSINISASSVADTSVKPTVTVSGKWTNKTSATTQDQELQTLLNNAQSRQNDLVSAMSNYTQSSQNLAVRILNWNYEKAQAEANMEYLEMLLENEKTLYSMGLATEQDVADAELNISQAKYDWDIMLIRGLSLQRDLEIFAL